MMRLMILKISENHLIKSPHLRAFTIAPCRDLQSLYLATTSIDQTKATLPCPDSNFCKSGQGSRMFAGTTGDK